MSEKSPLNRTLISLMIFYIFGALFAILASGSILMHVNPYSKCLLYSSHIGGGKLSYGNYASKYYLKISCVRTTYDNKNWIGILTTHVYIYRLHDGRICLSRCCVGRVISICKIMGWETQTGWACSNGVSSFLYYKR